MMKPWIIVWLEWMLYAYKLSLFASLGLFYARYCYQNYLCDQPNFWAVNLNQISLVLLTGLCAWVAYCALRYGYAVG